MYQLENRHVVCPAMDADDGPSYQVPSVGDVVQAIENAEAAFDRGNYDRAAVLAQIAQARALAGILFELRYAGISVFTDSA